MRLRIILVTTCAVALLLGGLVAPAAATPDPGHLLCPVGLQTTTFSPGLTFTSRPTNFSVVGAVSGCVSADHPQIVGGTYAGSGTAPASCLQAGVRVFRTINWNTGQQSVMEETGVVVQRLLGSTVVVARGRVVSGVFEGSSVTATLVLASLNPLACLGDGVKSVSGIISLIISP